MSLTVLKNALLGSLFFACSSLFAAPLVVNIDNAASYGEFGQDGNTVLTYDIGANSYITGISYDLNVTAYNPSWLMELGLAITNSKTTEGIFFNPGITDWFPGTAVYSGSADLEALDLAFYVGNDGILRLEFYEDYDDMFLSPDGRWNFGTITIDYTPQAAADVPEPATALLLGGGAMLMGFAGRRRARKATVTA